MDWRDGAVCASVDPELWFPEVGGDNGREAKRICWDRCHVREQCLAYALETGQQSGVWGGLGEKKRAELRTAEGAQR